MINTNICLKCLSSSLSRMQYQSSWLVQNVTRTLSTKLFISFANKSFSLSNHKTDQQSRLFFFFLMLIQLPINQIASYPNFILRLPVRQSPDSETRRDEDGGPQQKSQVPFSIKEDCLKQFIKAYNFCFNSLALHGIPHRSTAVHPSARGKEYHTMPYLQCSQMHVS